MSIGIPDLNHERETALWVAQFGHLRQAQDTEVMGMFVVGPLQVWVASPQPSYSCVHPLSACILAHVLSPASSKASRTPFSASGWGTSSILCCLCSPVMEIPTLKPLSEDQARFYFQDLIKGIEYCECLCKKGGISYLYFSLNTWAWTFCWCTVPFLVAYATAQGFLKLGLVVVLAERLTARWGLRGFFAADWCCC